MAKRKKSFRNRVTLGDVINSIVLLAFTFLCLYPFWYIFIGSISNPNIPVRTLTFLPKDVTLFNYKEVLQSKGLLEAMGISVARTVTGTLLSVLLTAFMAYLFTLQKMPARKLETLDLYVYRATLLRSDYSYGTAIGMLKSLISIGLMFGMNGLSKKIRGNSIF